MKKRILIIGGTSGVGLALARYYAQDGHTVCVTGRHEPDIALYPRMEYQQLNITDDATALSLDIDIVLRQFARVNTVVYCAGFLQRGLIDALSDAALQRMTNVGLLAPMLLIQRLKNNLDTPLKIMLITSSSQYTPRELEPAYCAVKSGLGMLGASLVRDHGIGKVLVVAPSGIDSKFWEGSGEDTSTMLDVEWVASQVVELSSGVFKYKYAKLLRDPARVDVVETLDGELNAVNS